MIKNYNLIILTFLALQLFPSCAKDDNEHPVTENVTPLEGTYKTNGLYQYIANRSVNLSLSFSNGAFEWNAAWYRWDTLTNVWVHTSNSVDTFSGTFTSKNSFIKFTDRYGATGDDFYYFHYSINGNKLTLNSAWDGGGIYFGTSNSFTGTLWVRHVSRYDTGSHTYSISFNKYIFNTDLTGLDIYEQLTTDYRDTNHISYTISGNELTIFYPTIAPYVTIYSVVDSQLFLYGKPRHTDNDDYWTFELFK